MLSIIGLREVTALKISLIIIYFTFLNNVLSLAN